MKVSFQSGRVTLMQRQEQRVASQVFCVYTDLPFWLAVDAMM